MKSCTWNGTYYLSISDAARVCGITPQAMAVRISKGYTCDNDVGHRPSVKKRRVMRPQWTLPGERLVKEQSE